MLLHKIKSGFDLSVCLSVSTAQTSEPTSIVFDMWTLLSHINGNGYYSLDQTNLGVAIVLLCGCCYRVVMRALLQKTGNYDFSQNRFYNVDKI